jgi:uncharacterized protein
MEALWIAFFTGLTTGGLSCMAVHGGLITGSLASQIEKDLAEQGASGGKPRLAMPIILFLIAKLIAYTLLGVLLGWVGSVFSLSPVARGILQMAIAVFMVGNALRMLKVHPIFRYFNFEPPAAVRRMIRRKSKGGDLVFTPLFLGALTVLIPCGVTQAMMATAIGTGSPLAGGALMFSFILGTSPVFFVLTYLATRLSALFEKYFVRIVALALLVLGLVALDSGLNLVGSPVTLGKLPQGFSELTGIQLPFVKTGAEGTTVPSETLSSEIRLSVNNNGYAPNKLYAPADHVIKLHLVTQNTTSCSRDFTIPAYNIEILLPTTGDKVIEIPAQTAGTTLHYSCSMGMYTGVIQFK